MALLAELYKVVLKAGLLPKIIRKLPAISLLTFFIGIGLLLNLPLDGNYRGTYISENALMPSQAYSYFRETEWNLLRGYRHEIVGFNNTNGIEANLQTLKSWIDDIGGFKTQLHQTEYNTTNLYAIWHAPRSEDTEAIVIGAPYYTSDQKFNIGGLALVISLARYFHRWSLWSKNIILVIPENPGESLRSWVNAYHTDLDQYAGSIESALMLDYSSDSDNFEYVELYYDGINGQLPNLDLINTCVSVTEHEGPRVSLHGTEQSELRTNDYGSRLNILLKGIKNSAFVGLKPYVGQEAFSGWRVQSLTLKARQSTSGKDDGPYDITTFGRIPEAVFRSVNNLLEKFHQSFFFYLLLAPRKFVSIGTYLPSAVLLIFGFVLSISDKIFNDWKLQKIESHLLELVSLLLSAIFIGFIIFQASFHLPSSVTIVALVTLSTSLSIGSSFTKFPYYFRSDVNIKPLLRALALSYFTLSLISLLVLNFALTFTLSIASLTITFIKDTKNKLSDVRNSILLLLANPFIWLSIIAYYDFPDTAGVNTFYHTKLFTIFENLISSSSNFGSYTWFILSIVIFPTWLLLAYSLFVEVSDYEKQEIEKKEK